MDSFFGIFTAIIGFGILVFFNELGHFLTAKFFKVKVEVFALGWGPNLFGFKRGETTYQISIFPIGGFCKFKGDEMTDSPDNLSKDPDSFYGTKPYKRLLIAFCGPLMNYIIAIIFLAFLAMGSYKEIYLPNKILLVDDVKTDNKTQ
ncbi:MAG TPA: site-2 protease family protein, partial [Spirochaetota bacterium]|nr:site-2 protease family protein [Spirochaetota bacterium]